MTIDQVLDEYRQGDADRRMSLFLYYRDLRDAFICIEQDDPADLFAGAGTQEPVKKGIVRKFLVMLRIGSWLLRSRTSERQVAP